MLGKSKLIDIIIIVLAIMGCFHAYYYMEGEALKQILIIFYFGLILIGIIDIIRKVRESRFVSEIGEDQMEPTLLCELSLLDEHDRVIRKWDIKDKTSLMIGRSRKEQHADIDLSESEYGALIDYQHATLNYSGGNWYIEDLYSKNGIRIRKQQDSTIYKLAKDKPCKLSAGDVILIANTKLLFR
ncbi:hypothetical protein FACS189418_7690 [Clostridia bacterium]|nr:hypothetical protein FACS189418_7690 [Clostridia bacterium]